MSKKNVFNFLFHASKDEQLRSRLDDATQEEVVSIAKEEGYDFSTDHVDEALSDLKKRPGFFGAIAEAAIDVFSPHPDDYPATGMQPFSGDPNK